MADATAALSARSKVQAFLEAARAGDLESLKKLAAALDEEGKGVAAVAAAVRDANKRTALHFAARDGRTDVCHFLISDLALPVDPKDDDGETPLIHATRQAHLQTVTYLLQHGADPSVASTLGATPLHHAAGIGNLDLMKLILSKGVDVESESDAGTPLIWAAGHGQQEAVKLLLQHDAKPNTETDDGITSLLSAVAAGSLPCLEILIQAGADLNIRAGGATPLHIAADGGNVEIVNCLLKAGSDPNACDDDGLKPIQVAALRNNREVVELLLPLTSPIPGVSSWSIDGIIEYTKSVEEKAQVKEATTQKADRLQRPQLVEVSSEAKERSLEAKSRGDDAFRNKDYLVAVDAYTQAIELNPNDATLHSNRSLCWLRAGQAERALEDARACRALRPDWAKACYREGAALRLLQRFEEAANAFYEGVQLEPENGELVSAFREAIEAGRKFHGTDKKQKANKADASIFNSVCVSWPGDGPSPPPSPLALALLPLALLPSRSSLLRHPIDLDHSASVCDFLLWISTKLIDQLARDDEKVKKKTRKPKPKKIVKQHQQEPQDNSRELPASEPKAPPGWPLQPPMYLPVTPVPPPPPPAISELEAIRAVLEESEKVQEKLDKQHAGMRDELIKKSKDLRDKEFKLPYQNPMPCTEERSNCRQCYVSNAQDPLKCAEAVKRFEACVRLARQRGNTKVFKRNICGCRDACIYGQM
uniref:Serine/threonine-protein kinase BSK1-like TPR repeats domain-containing protein n=1 Tax=Oryza punctata TaxID=4537 RepID=A0A0E0KXG6_ORYPU